MIVSSEPITITNEITLRDWFAGQAMQTLLRIGTQPPRELRADDGSTYETPDQPWYFGWWGPGNAEQTRGLSELAADAYQVADAMLAERSKRAEDAA